MTGTLSNCSDCRQIKCVCPRTFGPLSESATPNKPTQEEKWCVCPVPQIAGSYTCISCGKPIRPTTSQEDADPYRGSSGGGGAGASKIPPRYGGGAGRSSAPSQEDGKSFKGKTEAIRTGLLDIMSKTISAAREEGRAQGRAEVREKMREAITGETGLQSLRSRDESLTFLLRLLEEDKK